MAFRKLLITGLFLLCSQSAIAIQVSGLYQVTVPVSDESAKVQDAALKKAILQVLVKLTGNRNIHKNKHINVIVNQPKHYLQQFRYQQSAKEEGEQASLQTELIVQFDENTMIQALRDHGLSIWGKERPSILVWLAHEDRGTRHLVSLDTQTPYLTYIDKRAVARGVSLLFPLFDLEDTSRLSISDIWAGFKKPVMDVSKRYQARVVLTGRIVQLLPTLWEVRWIAYMEGQTLSWSNQSELAEIALEEGIDELVDQLATRYANTGSGRDELVELAVIDIDNTDAYANTLSYLESLQSVTSVKVKRVSNNKVTFDIMAHGGIDVLDQAIKLGKVLEQVDSKEQISYRRLYP